MSDKPLVSILMGSRSDKQIMEATSMTLKEFGIPHESHILTSRGAQDIAAAVSSAEEKGVSVIIAAGGPKSDLAGLCAAKTVLPVLGVPLETPQQTALNALLTLGDVPGETPVGTLAIGTAGAKNAALLAIAILATYRPELRKKLQASRQATAKKVLSDRLA